MEREGRVPIHLIFGRHEGKPGLKLVEAVEKKAIEWLQRSPNGCVVIFNEDAATTHDKAGVISTAPNHASDITPLDAMAWYYFGSIAGRTEAREALLSNQNEFGAASLKSIDRLFKAFPGRVRFAIESGTENEIAHNFQQLERAYELLDQSFAFVDCGQFDPALPKFQEGVTIINRVYEDREKRMGIAIQHGIQENPDTIALVGFAGSNHTPVARSLQKEGFFVDVSIPGKERGKFLFDPTIVALRMLRFSPKKISTNEQWMKALICTMLYDFFWSFKEKPREKPKNIKAHLSRWYMQFELRHLKTKQDIIRLVQTITRTMTNETLSELEQSIRKDGFPLAALNLMDSRRSKK